MQMMDFKQYMEEYGRRAGRATYAGPLGVGIDFADGCDAFWVLPGEVTSTFPLRKEPDPAEIERLIAEYERISHGRERALHVIQHYLASMRIHIDQRRNGEWSVTLESGISTTISVGAGLTTVIRDSNDVYAAVTACLKPTMLVKVPSRMRLDRYLRTAGPPTAPAKVPETAASRSTLRQALAWMRICRAIDVIADADSRDAVKAATAEAASPDGRIARTLRRVADRLPEVEGSIDLLKPGNLSIEFDDGFASFTIAARSRDLARLVAASGPEKPGIH